MITLKELTRRAFWERSPLRMTCKEAEETIVLLGVENVKMNWEHHEIFIKGLEKTFWITFEQKEQREQNESK
jgi:hypothetical protein